MTDIFRFLESNGIEYERFDHPPVYTVKDVKLLTPDIPGQNYVIYTPTTVPQNIPKPPEPYGTFDEKTAY